MADFTRSGFTHKRRQDELLKVAEQAAAWLIELEDGGVRERAAFAAWLEESPLHVEMFLRASSVDRITELMAPADVKALSQRVWADEGKSVEWIGKEPAATPLIEHAAPTRDLATVPRFSVPRRIGFSGLPRRLAGMTAGLLALVAALAWYSFVGPGAWDRYKTQVGEQRIVRLLDGSVIYVNTDSRIAVRYTETARDVRLLEGEALFKVEHDTQRPFQVRVGDTVVQAVGTQFNIYRRSGETKVAVVEGIVQVSAGRSDSPDEPPVTTAPASDTKVVTASHSRRAERLGAGQGVSLNADGVREKPVAVNVDQVTAWRQRRLVFEWQTLEEIAAEFNRYNRVPQIRVEGDSVRARRYTAVFDADSPQTLLKFLAQDNDLKFAAEGDDFVIRAR